MANEVELDPSALALVDGAKDLEGHGCTEVLCPLARLFGTVDLDGAHYRDPEGSQDVHRGPTTEPTIDNGTVDAPLTLFVGQAATSFVDIDLLEGRHCPEGLCPPLGVAQHVG